MGMSKHPSAHPILAPEIVTRHRAAFSVRDPLTGQTVYLRDEERAQSYAARFEIAFSCAGL